MKNYGEMKSVQSFWTESIPTHWHFNHLRTVFWERKENNDLLQVTEILSLSAKSGVQRYSDKTHEGGNKAKDDLTKYHIAYPGDLIVNCMNVISGSVGLSSYKGLISPVYYALVTRNNDYNRFYYNYIFSLETFQKSLLPLGKGILIHESSTGKLNTIRLRISMASLNNVFIPVPPRSEQDQIVRYLDYKTAKIDKLISGYKRQIELLEERKLTFINDSITGKNCECEYVESGVNWIGKVPMHWNIYKVKQHFKILKRIAGKEGYEVISITQQGLKIKDISTNEGQMAASYANYQFIYPGEYAMNHMDLLTGYMGLSDVFGVTSPDYRVFALTDTENCDPNYYLYVFQLGYKRKIFYGLGKGAANKGRWRMPAINFKNYDIPVPPIEEQKKIVDIIRKYEEKIDFAIQKVNEQIALLQEYRTRLISDVVTGQIDVRDEVIPEMR